MAKDAIAGARYRDETFDATFTITEIAAPDDGELPDDDEIDVSLQYDEIDLTTTVTLAQFRDEGSIELIEMPDCSD